MAKQIRGATLVQHETIIVRVPIAFRRRGGRKTVTTQDGLEVVRVARAQTNNSLIKAIVRAFRWRRLIETDVHANIQEIAAAEHVNDSYVGRVLRLTLLAPDIVEAILDGLSAPEVTLDALLRPFPTAWEDQRKALCKTA
jgi:hypothetical protein